MKRPTIRDVAVRAGVSHQTVSRVINGDRRVAPATGDRVLAAIRELDYEPNAIARSLSSNRTHTLGVVTYNVSEYALGQTVAGAEAEARRHGYFLFVGSVADAADEGDELAYLRLMLNRRVEGLILDWPTLRTSNDRSLAEVSSRMPLVAIAADLQLPGVQVVDIDNRRGGCEATAFLIAQRHRAIATITGPLAWNAAEARLQGYYEALSANGITTFPALVHAAGEWGPEGGQIATEHLLASGIGFTAIFAQSDLLALGAMTAIRARGLRVPEDISIIGYDDIPVASFLDPPLTTVHQPIRELGALAAKLLIESIAQRQSGEAANVDHHLLLPNVVVRNSVSERPTES
ncbi:MAG: LacI family DNA-binding transcriptional regulator [Thermomicrobiales bacterium]